LACVPCTAGSVAPEPGGTECTVCSPGRFSASPFLDCAQCPPGTFTETNFSTFCSPCRAGRYGTQYGTGDAACSGECEAGFWCSAGSTSSRSYACGSSAVFCPRNSSQPTAVTQGFFTTNSTDGTAATRSAEAPYPEGSYCNGDGKRYPCSEGFFQNSTGKSSCQPCPRGAAASSPGSVACSPCAPGWTSSLGASVCSPCRPGTARLEGQLHCAICPAGTIAATEAATSCTACPPGHIAPLAGLSYCTPCSPGQENSTDAATGLAVCIDCASGRASAQGRRAKLVWLAGLLLRLAVLPVLPARQVLTRMLTFNSASCASRASLLRPVDRSSARHAQVAQ
jgi:hypothetical protein